MTAGDDMLLNLVALKQEINMIIEDAKIALDNPEKLNYATPTGFAIWVDERIESALGKFMKAIREIERG